MQKPIPAKVPYRPQIRRVSHRELEDTGISNEWDTSYGSVGFSFCQFCDLLDLLFSQQQPIDLQIDRSILLLRKEVIHGDPRNHHREFLRMMMMSK